MRAIDAGYVRSVLPRRRVDASKQDCGRALLLCGSARYLGAPYFAAQAAVNTGCGLCYLSVPDEILPILGVKLNEPIFLPRAEADAADARYQAVLVGPGLSRSEAAREITRDFMRRCVVPAVFDADALYFLAQEPELLRAAPAARILTPHEGEFRRFMPDFSSRRRAECAVLFAKSYGCILILKGAATVVALPDGRFFVNTTGNPGMAKGGSGDVLAGVLVSLLAQGLSPEDAACAGVFLHGLAGDLAQKQFGTLGMTPTDTLSLLPRAICEV